MRKTYAVQSLPSSRYSFSVSLHFSYYRGRGLHFAPTKKHLCKVRSTRRAPVQSERSLEQPALARVRSARADRAAGLLERRRVPDEHETRASASQRDLAAEALSASSCGVAGSISKDAHKKYTPEIL